MWVYHFYFLNNFTEAFIPSTQSSEVLVHLQRCASSPETSFRTFSSLQYYLSCILVRPLVPTPGNTYLAFYLARKQVFFWTSHINGVVSYVWLVFTENDVFGIHFFWFQNSIPWCGCIILLSIIYTWVNCIYTQGKIVNIQRMLIKNPRSTGTSNIPVYICTKWLVV